ncbi:hypothetical protein [Nocardioides montaniterrae]
MSNSSIWATVVFAIFAFGFIGVLLGGSFILDKRRSEDVEHDVPDRIQEAAERSADRHD